MKTKSITEKNIKVCLVGSSGGHLTHLYMLKPFWKDKNRFWVTFDKEDSLEKFVAFENKSKLTNAKKLLKAKNSPVLQMKKNDLLENLKKHSRYKTMFKFEEDHIVISSQKEAAAFIKMLNDDIVRSELTGKEYDSSSKMLLAPMGSSQ